MQSIWDPIKTYVCMCLKVCTHVVLVVCGSVMHSCFYTHGVHVYVCVCACMCVCTHGLAKLLKCLGFCLLGELISTSGFILPQE